MSIEIIHKQYPSTEKCTPTLAIAKRQTQFLGDLTKHFHKNISFLFLSLIRRDDQKQHHHHHSNSQEFSMYVVFKCVCVCVQ